MSLRLIDLLKKLLDDHVAQDRRDNAQRDGLAEIWLELENPPYQPGGLPERPPHPFGWLPMERKYQRKMEAERTEREEITPWEYASERVRNAAFGIGFEVWRAELLAYVFRYNKDGVVEGDEMGVGRVLARLDKEHLAQPLLDELRERYGREKTEALGLPLPVEAAAAPVEESGGDGRDVGLDEIDENILEALVRLDKASSMVVVIANAGHTERVCKDRIGELVKAGLVAKKGQRKGFYVTEMGRARLKRLNQSPTDRMEQLSRGSTPTR